MKDLRKAVLEIFRWQYDHTNSFFNRLILLIQMADQENRARLRLAFPWHVIAFELWCSAPNQEEFFREWVPEEMEKMAGERS